MFYPFAVILTFLLPLDHEVDKMSLSHANEIWKYIMNLIFFQISDLDSDNPATVHPSNQKIKKVTLQHAEENPRKVCKNVCKSQNVCPNIFHIHYIPLGLGTFAWLLKVSILIYIYVESGDKL